MVLYLPDGGLREFYDCTIGFQFGRDSVFSLWGLHPSLDWLQDVVKVAGLGCSPARSRSCPAGATCARWPALGAAALIAAQLGVNHWFYFYIPWFTPFALLAMFGAYRAHEPGTSAPAPAAGRPRASRPPSKGHRPRADMDPRPQVPRLRGGWTQTPDHPDRHLTEEETMLRKLRERIHSGSGGSP